MSLPTAGAVEQTQKTEISLPASESPSKTSLPASEPPSKTSLPASEPPSKTSLPASEPPSKTSAAIDPSTTSRAANQKNIHACLQDQHLADTTAEEYRDSRIAQNISACLSTAIKETLMPVHKGSRYSRDNF
ncbi:hypothetical protein P692DRAFT_201863596 [Suillus brevipes Sb2]|nr:hypothetical protein P692DRAFT_201863596 [Suillus brevipes Sb2]